MGYTARRALQPRNARIYRAYYVIAKLPGTRSQGQHLLLSGRKVRCIDAPPPTGPAFVSVFEFSPPVINVIPSASCDDAVSPAVTRYQPLLAPTDFARVYTTTTTTPAHQRLRNPSSSRFPDATFCLDYFQWRFETGVIASFQSARTFIERPIRKIRDSFRRAPTALRALKTNRSRSARRMERIPLVHTQKPLQEIPSRESFIWVSFQSNRQDSTTFFDPLHGNLYSGGWRITSSTQNLWSTLRKAFPTEHRRSLREGRTRTDGLDTGTS